MRRPFFLIALALTACQSQAGAQAGPQATQSPSAPPGDLIYVQDPNGPRMLEMDWAGKVHGSVSARGFSTPSPDGSRYFRATDRIVVEDWRGHPLGALDADASSYGLGMWADDGQHFCGIVVAPGSGPDAGTASLWIGTPGTTGRIVASVGKSGSQPGIAACSLKNDRAIVASGLFPHWPPMATRWLITEEIQVVKLSTGTIEYEHQYPLGYLAGQGAPGATPDWVLVAASPDAQYVAESGVFNGATAIRELRSGKLANIHGSVRGFSWDGLRVVVSLWNGNSDYEAELIRWADQKVLWHRSVVAQTMLARPDTADVMIGVSGPAGGAPELVVVDSSGISTTIARDAMMTWPCPCPAGP